MAGLRLPNIAGTFQPPEPLPLRSNLRGSSYQTEDTPQPRTRNRSPSPSAETSDTLEEEEEVEEEGNNNMTTLAPDTRPSGVSLSTVRLLESAEDWLQWDQEIRDYLILSGYNDLLTRNTAIPPATGTPAAAQLSHEAEIEAWQDKQDRARAAIRYRCGYNARTLIAQCTTALEALTILESSFRPYGSRVFTELCKRFYELTLADCKSVTDYAKRFRKVQNELISLHPTLTLPEPFVVQKFLHGLGPAYDMFHFTFNQAHNILPQMPAKGEAPQLHVTFDITALEAINEERRIASQEEERTPAQGFLAAPRVS